MLDPIELKIFLAEIVCVFEHTFKATSNRDISISFAFSLFFLLIICVLDENELNLFCD